MASDHRLSPRTVDSDFNENNYGSNSNSDHNDNNYSSNSKTCGKVYSAFKSVTWEWIVREMQWWLLSTTLTEEQKVVWPVTKLNWPLHYIAIVCCHCSAVHCKVLIYSTTLCIDLPTRKVTLCQSEEEQRWVWKEVWHHWQWMRERRKREGRDI